MNSEFQNNRAQRLAGPILGLFLGMALVLVLSVGTATEARAADWSLQLDSRGGIGIQINPYYAMPIPLMPPVMVVPAPIAPRYIVHVPPHRHSYHAPIRPYHHSAKYGRGRR